MAARIVPISKREHLANAHEDRFPACSVNKAAEERMSKGGWQLSTRRQCSKKDVS